MGQWLGRWGQGGRGGSLHMPCIGSLVDKIYFSLKCSMLSNNFSYTNFMHSYNV